MTEWMSRLSIQSWRDTAQRLGRFASQQLPEIFIAQRPCWRYFSEHFQIFWNHLLEDYSIFLSAVWNSHLSMLIMNMQVYRYLQKTEIPYATQKVKEQGLYSKPQDVSAWNAIIKNKRKTNFKLKLLHGDNTFCGFEWKFFYIYIFLVACKSQQT